MSEKIKVAIAGSTERTVICAEALLADSRYVISWILTPTPRIVGRKKVLTKNSLHKWAEKHSIEILLVEQKIDNSVKDTILGTQIPDILLVVDFGYLVPTWLLELPKVASLNVHPSLLPRWRGSSPGQFVLLYGEKKSAVTLMVMDEGLDTGAIITQLPFSVGESWTQTEYYQHSFGLIQPQLADLVADFVAGTITVTSQPAQSPTLIARRLTREDGFVEWTVVQDLMSGMPVSATNLNPLFKEALSAHPNVATLLASACRAFSPWPGLWTTIKGQRLKILSCHLENEKLILDQVQLEGKQPTSWLNIKSQIVE